MMATPQTPTVPAGSAAQGGLPDGCWKRLGDQDPRIVLGPGRRAVVTEFDVELVEYQFQLPIPRQPMVKGPPISINPVHMAIKLIGIGRRYTQMTEEAQQALTSDLYNAFLQDLRRRGLEVVSSAELLASSGYTELSKASQVGSSPLMYLNRLGSDTGTVLHTRTVAAPGLCILQGSLRGTMGTGVSGFLDYRMRGLHLPPRECARARAAAEERILRETQADVALAVRLRVGLFREQPALEHRSVIRLTTPEGSTTLQAGHSMISDLVVTEAPRFRPLVGRIEPVDSGRLSDELTAMFPKFLALAFEEPSP